MKRLHIELLIVGIALHVGLFLWMRAPSAPPVPESPPNSLQPFDRGAGSTPPVEAARTEPSYRGATLCGRNGLVGLPLRHTQVDAEVVGVMSSVRVQQVFVNDGSEALDATYRFPLPAGAAVHAMTLQVGPRRIVAQIQRRDEARSTYEAARSHGQTAALLEQQRPNLFSWDVANIRPGDTVTVSLEYAQELVPTGGRYLWEFPMTVGTRYIPGGHEDPAVNGPTAERSGRDVAVSLTLHAGVVMRGIRSDTHAVGVTQDSPREARVVLSAHDTIPNRDLVVGWQLTGDRPQATLLARDEAIGGGHFLLMVQPRAAMDLSHTAPREYLFVVDTSGSMGGAPLQMARGVMQRCLGAVRPGDTFQIVQFASGASSFAPAPVAPSPATVARALAWVDSMQSGGGTEFLPALELAFRQPRTPGHARVVVFMTDGYIGNEAEVLAWLHARTDKGNLFALGIGSSVNRYLLEGMARIGRGRPFMVLDPASETEVVRDLFATIARPALTDLTLHWDGVAVYDTTPEHPPDLFADRPVVITGRYARPGRGTLTLRGMLAGRPYTETLAVDLQGYGGAPTHPALSYLWARRRIDDLMDAYTFAPPDRRSPLAAQVTELALAYHQLSDFTSFVAVDPLERGAPADLRVVEPTLEPVQTPGVQPHAGLSMVPLQAPMAQPYIALSHDQVAPGDPEIAVRAPAGTRSVTAHLPDGETLPLVYDPRRDLWVANFVVAHDTPDGVYTIGVDFTLHDGSTFTRRARFEVDARPPEFVATTEPMGLPGAEIVLRVVPAARAPAPAVDWTDVGSTTFAARVGHEVERVEVLLPDGTVEAATADADGSFSLRFRAPTAHGLHRLDVVARDAAGNATRRVVPFTVRGE